MNVSSQQFPPDAASAVSSLASWTAPEPLWHELHTHIMSLKHTYTVEPFSKDTSQMRHLECFPMLKYGHFTIVDTLFCPIGVQIRGVLV